MGLLELYPENFVQSNATNTVKTTVQLIKEYDDVFEGDIGTLSGIQRLEVDPSMSPTMSPPRRVPFALKSALKEELERLTILGVIKPVDEPTDCVSIVGRATKPSGDRQI